MSWHEKDNKLIREFEFSSFTEAFGFLTKVAIEAEKVNHHPEIKNVYNKVTLSLMTHDEGKITNKDHNLAETINDLL